MIRWWFNPAYRGQPAEGVFADIDRAFAAEGEPITRDILGYVERVTAGATRFYVKRYQGNGRTPFRNWFGLRAWFGLQRVKREWENLLAFQSWGIPTAIPVAYGLERRFGAFVRGALVTEELKGTRDLADLALSGDLRLQDRPWVSAVLHQVARATRSMHAAGFAHNDLKWRNLLVDDSPQPTVYFIDCPTGQYWWGVFLRYRIVKDLACLDKLGKYHLSRSQRLRFYLDYVGRSRLSAEDKTRIRKILAFFEGRE